MEDLKQCLMEDGYFRQEELTFWDCDREKRVRIAAILSKLGAFAGYDYDARGLTHEKLYAMGEPGGLPAVPGGSADSRLPSRP